jgi:hypothetical protein
MNIIKVRRNANSPWETIDVLVGPQGEAGYTPVKGVDYFDGKDGLNGKDGKDGKDYVLTEADKREIAGMVEVSGDDVDIDLTDYYTKSEVDGLIPDTSGFTTMSAVEQKGYQTKAQVEALITAAMPASGEEVQY